MEKWLAMAENKDIEYIISLDYDDETLHQYKMEFLEHGKDVKMIYNDNRSAVGAINYAASCTTGDIIIVVSDDFSEPLQNWDRLILDEIGDRKDWILKTQDGQQPWIITLPIMDRAYYNRFGYVYYPEYLHLFCDTEMTNVADYLDRKITSNLLFRHNHYTVTGHWDDLSVKSNQTWQQGEALYLQRYRENFGIAAEDIKKVNFDNSHIQWLNSKGMQIPQL